MTEKTTRRRSNAQKAPEPQTASERELVIQEAQQAGWTPGSDREPGTVSFMRRGRPTVRVSFSAAGKVVRARTMSKVFLGDDKLQLVLDHLRQD